MDQYADIRLRPDPEFPSPLLMGALFGKLHRALVALDASDIGVSFPEYSKRPRSLGETLRLHGTSSALEGLMARDWLLGMRDHVSIGGISTVPDMGLKHCLVRRRHVKTNAERLRRRRAKRHGESMEQARAWIPDDVERRTEFPFVTLRSLSTGERFSLFIEQSAPLDAGTPGAFNRYGLSRGGTVPWF